MIENIDEKGWLRFSEPHALELIKLEEFTLVNTEERQRDNGEKDVDPKLNERLNLFGHYLHQKYVVPTYPKSEFTYYNVWDGVDKDNQGWHTDCLLYTSPSPRDVEESRMPSSA